jgi:vitamin K-dependent gamma-carboxylase-like protein
VGRWRDFWIGEADLAPLAVFRILFGAQLFNWFWQLYPNLAPFFTDEGLLPRNALLGGSFADRFSVLNLVGDWWQVAVLWFGSLLVALLLTVGWHTRTMSILAFLAVSSFSWRDPLILDGSDFAFRMIPFWLAFTNAGELYAVDAAIRRTRGDMPTGRGPALPVRILELQVGWIYLMTGLEKLGGTYWKDGTATYYALQLEHTFGRWYAYPVASQPLLYRAMTWGTLVIELAFVPLIAIPAKLTRLVAVAAGIALHGGILVLMNVGNFPIIMLSTLVLFVPAPWLRALADRVSAEIDSRAVPLASALAAGVRAAGHLDRPTVRGAVTRAAEDARARSAGALALGFLAAAVFSTALPRWLDAYQPKGDFGELLRFLSIDQRWDMFSPDPARADGWLRAPATLVDGTTLDLLTGGPPTDEPRWTDPLYTRWVKVQERISSAAYADYLLEYSRSFCRLRNFHLRAGQSALDTFELYYVERTIQPPGDGPPMIEEHRLWSHKC